VAVLLEIARQLSISKPAIGIDIVFFDMEDYGNQNGNNPETWCLGSQYWAKRPHKPDYYAQFGILLDQSKTLLQNGQEAFKKGDFSLVGGAQIHIAKIRLQGRYFVGLNNISDVGDQNKWNNSASDWQTDDYW